ncbi:uncharacterized protein LOC135399765 [Ornithodoros turicata]|uniref:uncharacterized protein LOC135399765 n=1 Tax=Ornithodoros turicata TaxID=34597 RepID=UPI003138A074
MFQYLLLSVLATAAFAGDDDDTTRYMDNVLKNYLPENMKRNQLEYARLPPFNVRMGEDAEPFVFGKGLLFDLMGRLQRDGNCSPSQWYLANVTFGCYLATDDLRAHYDVSSEKEEDKKLFSADLLTENTTIWVVVTQRKPKPVHVNVDVHRLGVTLHLSKKPDLDEEKLKWFINTVKSAVKQRITDVLTGPFRTALEQSVETLPIPLPSLR